MSMSALVGVTLSFLAVISALLLEGTNPLILLNLPSFIIVILGSIFAVIIQTPSPVLYRTLNLLRWVISPPRYNFNHLISVVSYWSKKSKKDGILSVESNIYKLNDPFLITCGELLLRNLNKDILEEIIKSKILSTTHRDIEAAQVLQAMGGYAPTLGILGAVLGLMQVLQNISDPTMLGHGIAVAFIATIYGICSANLIFIPLANRIEAHVEQRTRFYEMYLIGLLALKDEHDFNVIKLKMNTYLYENNE